MIAGPESEAACPKPEKACSYPRADGPRIKAAVSMKKHKPPMACATGGFESLDAEPRPLVPLHLELFTVCRFSQQCLSF